MTQDICRELEADYREFTKGPSPKLGYSVDDLPEASSFRAVLVSQALNPVWRATIPRLDNEPILTQAMIAEAKKICDVHRGSDEASRLEAYIARMKKMEENLRKLISEDARGSAGDSH